MIFFSTNPNISSRLTNAEEFFAYLVEFPAFNSLQRSPGALPKSGMRTWRCSSSQRTVAGAL